MINELYQLSEAMERASVITESWHRKYQPLPKVKEQSPCIRIVLSDKKVDRVETVKTDMAAKLRKYGSNQGTFPAMNLAPLYRITDERIKKELSNLLRGKFDKLSVEQIKSWCSENNWGANFCKKYSISMLDVPKEIEELFERAQISCTPVLNLIQAVKAFPEPQILHAELTRVAFAMLDDRVDIIIALRILFYIGNAQKEPKNDYGTLSVILDSIELMQMGMTTASIKFTKAFNQALLQAATLDNTETEMTETDAFGHSFSPLEEPMPSVKLEGGFEVKLRTMFKGQPCQTRYGRIENATYPISPIMRSRLQSALTWVSGIEQKNVTWMNTEKNEILFVYPWRLPQVEGSYTNIFKKLETGKEETFKIEAEKFLENIQKIKGTNGDSNADRIQLLILRKIDKGRTKVVYSYNTDPEELVRCCEAWLCGGQNLSSFPFGKPVTPFPLQTADILNWVWKQDGTLVADKYKLVSYYHGLELLFEVQEQVALKHDLRTLVNNTRSWAPFLGRKQLAEDRAFYATTDCWHVKQTLALMGILLYKLNIRKEHYMQDFAYLYGQLLKASDELHALYCQAERKDKELPSQLAGSSLYIAATEAPYNTLAQLGQRMSPYFAWAKSYRAKNIIKNGVSSKLVSYYLSVCEKICLQLKTIWNPKTRFTEIEKAQLFIGYLAAFPKKENSIPADNEMILDKMGDMENEQ